MPDQVPRAERERRSHEAGQVAQQLHRAFLRSKVGQVLPVLFDQEKEGLYSGFSPEYCEVRVSGQGLHNQVHPVRITGLAEDHLTGELLDAPKEENQ